MINYITMVKMGTNETFIHLIKRFRKVFNFTNSFFRIFDFFRKINLIQV